MKRFDGISKLPIEILQARLARLTEVILEGSVLQPEDAQKKLSDLQEICRSDASAEVLIYMFKCNRRICEDLPFHMQ